MPKRPIANLLGLAVLGVLVQRPLHRYEIATTIRAQGKDADMAVKWGSLYTVVGSLERHGFVEAAGTDRTGARPERTVYRITDAGRREMIEWTRDLIADADPAHPDVVAGLSMLGALDPDEARALLVRRRDRLDTALASRSRANIRAATHVPRLFRVEDEYGIAMLAAEIDWLRTLIESFDDGTLVDLETWRSIRAGMLGDDRTAEGARSD